VDSSDGFLGLALFLGGLVAGILPRTLGTIVGSSQALFLQGVEKLLDQVE
jgi:hypothetical protein